jgi:hypothetical protein
VVSRVRRRCLRVLSIVQLRLLLVVRLWLLVLIVVAHGRLVPGALPIPRGEAAGKTQTWIDTRQHCGLDRQTAKV